MKINLILILFCLICFNGASAQEEISWFTCIKEAAENHPDLIAAQESVKQSEASKQQAASGLFPQITGEVRSPSVIDSAQELITKIIIKQHHLNKDEEDSFQIRNMSDIRKTLETTTKTMSFLLGVIAAISLLVGGIGIKINRDSYYLF